MAYGTPAEAAAAFVAQVKGKLEGVMVGKGISRAELARRLEVTPEYVDRLFDGDGELSLRTIAEISDVLGYTCSITLPHRPEEKTS